MAASSTSQTGLETCLKHERRTGALVWARQISEYTGVAGDFARTTPAISGNLLIFGNQGGRFFTGAKVMAVDKNSGDLAWVVQADDHPASFITQSAVVAGNTVYVGVSSLEELYAAVIPGYELSFRGSMLALNRKTGAILWRTYMTPDGFTGNAVWGSAPAIDHSRSQLYIATGNTYSAPQEFLDCILAAGDDEDAQLACLARKSHREKTLGVANS